MSYPTDTDWPGSLDAAETRANGEIIDGDDFNYQDKQSRRLQAFIGITGELLGAGITAQGPGGLLSPIASGASNIAHKLLARASFAAGKLFSVGDNYDAAPPAYTEKMHLTYQGILWLLGGFQIGSSTQVDGILDEDDLNSDSDTSLATQQSIKAYVDSEVIGNVAKIVVGNSVAGDTIRDCDYLDVGNGAQLEAALAAASSGDDIYIRSGVYDMSAASGPSSRFSIPSNVRVRGAGRTQVTIKTNVSGDCGAFLLGDGAVLEDIAISALEPTGLQTTSTVLVEGSSGTFECRRVHVDFDGAWTGASEGNIIITAGISLGTGGSSSECVVSECRVAQIPKITAGVEGISVLATDSRITNCHTEGGDYGVRLANAANSTIEGCVVDNCRGTGVRVQSSDGASVLNCRLSDGAVANFYGVSLSGGDSALIADNWLEATANGGEYGIYAETTNYSIFRGNRGNGEFGGTAFLGLAATADYCLVAGNAANGDSFANAGDNNEIVHNR